MRILGPGPLNEPLKTGRPRKANGESFSIDSASSSAAPTESASISPTSALDALLFVQEIDSQSHSKRETIDHAFETLDALDDLKTALLSGERTDLNALKDLASASKRSDDPHLNDMADAVEVRARVELAKRGIYVD